MLSAYYEYIFIEFIINIFIVAVDLIYVQPPNCYFYLKKAH